jgi:hypothetical protein
MIVIARNNKDEIEHIKPLYEYSWDEACSHFREKYPDVTEEAFLVNVIASSDETSTVTLIDDARAIPHFKPRCIFGNIMRADVAQAMLYTALANLFRSKIYDDVDNMIETISKELKHYYGRGSECMVQEKVVDQKTQVDTAQGAEWLRASNLDVGTDVFHVAYGKGCVESISNDGVIIQFYTGEQFIFDLDICDGGEFLLTD